MNYSIARNKRRDVVSKKTVRKVVYKGICQGVFVNALLRGVNGFAKEERQDDQDVFVLAKSRENIDMNEGKVSDSVSKIAGMGRKQIQMTQGHNHLYPKERSAQCARKSNERHESETTERKDQKDGKRSPVLPPTINQISPKETTAVHTEQIKSPSATRPLAVTKSVKSPNATKFPHTPADSGNGG